MSALILDLYFAFQEGVHVQGQVKILFFLLCYMREDMSEIYCIAD